MMMMMMMMTTIPMKMIRLGKRPAGDFSLSGLIKMSAQSTRDWSAVCKTTIKHHHL